MSTLVPGKDDTGADDWQRIGEVVEQKEWIGHAQQLNLMARSLAAERVLSDRSLRSLRI